MVHLFVALALAVDETLGQFDYAELDDLFIRAGHHYAQFVFGSVGEFKGVFDGTLEFLFRERVPNPLARVCLSMYRLHLEHFERFMRAQLEEELGMLEPWEFVDEDAFIVARS